MQPIKIYRDNKFDLVETTKFFVTVKAKHYGPIIADRIDWFFETQAGTNPR